MCSAMGKQLDITAKNLANYYTTISLEASKLGLNNLFNSLNRELIVELNGELIVVVYNGVMRLHEN